MKRFVLLSAIALLAIGLSGCGGKEELGNVGKDNPEAAKDIKGDLLVWGSSAGDTVNELFQKKYPNVKLILDTPSKHEDATIVALAAGSGAPDVVELSQAHYWKFRTVDGLENLLAAPYNAVDLRKDFVDGAWKMSTTLDGKKLFGIPWRYTPYVMFYRADIFEQNGFPSDPKEVGKYVSDPEQFFSMAMKMRSKGHYFFRSLGNMSTFTVGDTFFNSKMEYIRNTESYVKSLDYLKRANQLQLVFSGTKEEQDQAVNNGRLVAYFGGLYRVSTFQDGSKSEAYGKWKVTTTPFGQVYGQGYGTYSIPSQSKNKEAAWEYIKFITMGEEALKENLKTAQISPYRPSWNLPEFKDTKDPAFGGQNTLAFGASIMDGMKYEAMVKADDSATDIWDEIVDEGLKKNMDSRALMQQAQEAIEKKLAAEIAEMKKFVAK